MAFCTKCGAKLEEGAAFCASCGAPVAAPAPPTPTPSGPASRPPAANADLTPNVAGMLAYFTFIPAILFLLIEPYNKDRFVRFHAFQSLFFCFVWIVFWIAAAIVGMLVALVPVIGWTLLAFLHAGISLAGLVLWVILVAKAYQNEKFQLPFIGPMAEVQANR